MLAASESAFSRIRRCNLGNVAKDTLEYDIVIATYSKMNLCRVNTVVLLQDLKASEAAATAWSNSSFVVSGTRVRSVCVDCCDVFPGQEKWRVRYTAHWVHYVNPLGCPTLHKLPAYEILSVLPRGACTFPVPGKFLGFFTYN